MRNAVLCVTRVTGLLALVCGVSSVAAAPKSPPAARPRPQPPAAEAPSAVDLKAHADVLRDALRDVRTEAADLRLDFAAHLQRAQAWLTDGVEALRAGARRIAERRLEKAEEQIRAIRALIAETDPDPATMDPGVLAAAKRGKRLRLEQVRNTLVESTRTARALGVDVRDLDARAESLLARAGEKITLGRIARAELLLAEAADAVAEVTRRVQLARASGRVTPANGGADGVLTIVELTKMYEQARDADAFMNAVHAAVYPPEETDHDERRNPLTRRREEDREPTAFAKFVQVLYDEHFGEPYRVRSRDEDETRRKPGRKWNKPTLYRRLAEAIDPQRYEGQVKNSVDQRPVAWGASIGDDVLWLNGHHPNVQFTGNIGNDRVMVRRPSSVDRAVVSLAAGQDRFDFQGTLKHAVVDGGDERDRFRVIGNVQGSRFQGGDGNDSMGFAGTVESTRVLGGEGHDRLLFLGAVHGTSIEAGDGNDVIVLAGDARRVRLDLGEGNDTVSLADTFVGEVTIVDPEGSSIDWKGRWLKNHDVVEFDGRGWSYGGQGHYFRKAGGRVIATVRIGDGDDEEIEVIRALPHQMFREREPDVGKPPFGAVLGQILTGVAFAWVPGPGGLIISSTWAIARSDGDPFAIASGALGIAAGGALAADAANAARTLSALSAGVGIAGRFADGDVTVSDVLGGVGFALQQANKGEINDAVRVVNIARSVAGMSERGMVDPLGLFEIVESVVGLVRDDERTLHLEKTHMKAKDLDEIYLALGAQLGILRLASAPATMASGNWTFDPRSPRSFDSTAALQNRLRQLGYYRGPVDGVWNGSLDAAISDFHVANQTAAPGTTTVGAGTAARLFDDARSYAASNPVAQARLSGNARGVDYDLMSPAERARRWRGVLNHLTWQDNLSEHNGMGTASSVALRPVVGVPVTVNTSQRYYGGRPTGSSVTLNVSTGTPFVGAGGGTRIDQPLREWTVEGYAQLTLRDVLNAAGLAATALAQPQIGVPLIALSQTIPANIGLRGSVAVNIGYTRQGVPFVRVNVARGVVTEGPHVGGSAAQVRSWQVRLDRLDSVYSNIPDGW